MTLPETLLKLAADGRAHPRHDYFIAARIFTEHHVVADFWRLVDHGHLVRVPGDGCWWYALPDSPAHRESLHACAIRHAPCIARDAKPRPRAPLSAVSDPPRHGGNGHLDQTLFEFIAASGEVTIPILAAKGKFSAKAAGHWVKRRGDRLLVERRRPNVNRGGSSLFIRMRTKATA